MSSSLVQKFQWAILFVWVASILGGIAFWVGLGYVVLHFIHKAW